MSSVLLNHYINHYISVYYGYTRSVETQSTHRVGMHSYQHYETASTTMRLHLFPQHKTQQQHSTEHPAREERGKEHHYCGRLCIQVGLYALLQGTISFIPRGVKTTPLSTILVVHPAGISSRSRSAFVPRYGIQHNDNQRLRAGLNYPMVVRLGIRGSTENPCTKYERRVNEEQKASTVGISTP
jgi:hypothetical protein